MTSGMHEEGVFASTASTFQLYFNQLVACHSQAEDYLTLKKNDVIVICQRGKDWAKGRLAGQQDAREGLVPLEILEAKIFVQQCTETG